MSELNIKSTTVEKSFELAKDLLQSLVGKPIEEMGLLISDNLKVWRLKNQVRNLDKVRKIIMEGNITTKQVNMKVLFPYLEAVSLEEEDELQDMWANLFVNYIDTESKLESTVYPRILEQLSTKDVQILKEFYREGVFYDEYGLPHKQPETSKKYMPGEVANLERLGLIFPTMRKSDMLHSSGNTAGLLKNYIPNMDYPHHMKVTKFGDEFYKACQPKK